MNTSIDYAVIQPYIDGEKYGERIAPCFISWLGETDGLRVVRAEEWNPSTVEEQEGPIDPATGKPRTRMVPREPGFVHHDSLTDASVKYDDRRKRWIITGVSARLMNEQHLPPHEATIEWEVEARGCQGC